MAGSGGALFAGRSEERREVERFVDALRLWLGKRPLYKLERNEACLDWFHRALPSGNSRSNGKGSGARSPMH